MIHLSGISKQICLLDNYSKFELPITEGVNKIYVSIDIDEVLRINDKDYSITFATYFNVEWSERRLFVDPELEVRNGLAVFVTIFSSKDYRLMTLNEELLTHNMSIGTPCIS